MAHADSVIEFITLAEKQMKNQLSFFIVLC